MTESVALCIISTFNLCIGLFVFLRKPGSLVHRAFCLAALGIAVWGFGLVLIAGTHDFIFDSMTIYGFSLFLLGFVMFARVFPDTAEVPKKFYLIFIPLAAIAAIAPFGLIISGARYHPGNQPEAVNGPLFPLFAAVLVFYFLSSLYLFFRTYRTARGARRLQLNYLIFGLVFFLASTAIFDVFLPMVGVFQLNFLGPISSIALTGLAGYAIVRHQLLDIKVIIQRGLIYIILLGLVTGVYIAGFQLLGYFLGEVTNADFIASAGFTMILGILFFHPLEQYFRKQTDHIFFKGRYDYASTMYRLSRTLYLNLREEDLFAHSRAVLEDVFKTSDITFILQSEAIAEISPAESSAGSRTIAAPIMFEEKAVGVLRLGEKRSGDFYTQEDRQMISTFAYQMAISLGKARLHAKVLEYNSQLERLVEDRTSEIKKLQEEQKRAMIDISHNLQTPLAVIKGELELLPEFSADSEKMGVVRKSITRVSDFIRQLLHLAKLEGSVHEVELAPVNLSSVVSEQADYFDVMARESGVRMVSGIEEGVTILGNKRLLEELLTNLAVNAIKYRRPDAESVLRVSLAETDEGARLVVEDNGIGISAENIPDIFSRFYRVPGASEHSAGAGLGLAIAKKIVEKHKGEISAASVPGESTKFSIVFPKFRE